MIQRERADRGEIPAHGRHERRKREWMGARRLPEVAIENTSGRGGEST
jgi:hypothetical protein